MCENQVVHIHLSVESSRCEGQRSALQADDPIYPARPRDIQTGWLGPFQLCLAPSPAQVWSSVRLQGCALRPPTFQARRPLGGLQARKRHLDNVARMLTVHTDALAKLHLFPKPTRGCEALNAEHLQKINSESTCVGIQEMHPAHCPPEAGFLTCRANKLGTYVRERLSLWQRGRRLCSQEALPVQGFKKRKPHLSCSHATVSKFMMFQLLLTSQHALRRIHTGISQIRASCEGKPLSVIQDKVNVCVPASKRIRLRDQLLLKLIACKSQTHGAQNQNVGAHASKIEGAVWVSRYPDQLAIFSTLVWEQCSKQSPQKSTCRPWPGEDRLY